MNIQQLFAQAARPVDGRAVLTIPTEERVDDQRYWQEVEPVLLKAAAQIVASKLVYRWNRFTGETKLVRWSAEDKLFVSLGDADLWRQWLGQHWRIFDTAGFEWAGPSRAVGSRIYAAVLQSPDLPLASFGLQGQWQKEGKK